MAYDEEMAERIRQALEGEPGLTEKRMFGGLAFLVHGNMAAAATSKGALMLRVDPSETDALVTERGAERMEMRGRSMNGWITVDPSVLDTAAALERWLEHGVGYARTFPPKS